MPDIHAQTSKTKPVALVIGAGDATGGAVAERFARGGYAVCATRRERSKLDALVARIETTGATIHAFGSDARDEAAVVALIDHIERHIGPIEVLVFNIGANSPMSILSETARRVTKMWELACLAGFLNAREVALRMVARESMDPVTGARPVGTIIFTGATASLRGGAGFAGFAMAKHGLRALAQSMARELGPRGIHVAHSIIDGAIDTAFIRDNFPQRYALKDQDGIVNPASIAEQYWQLHQQSRDCWTHELDLRPYMEKF